MFNRCFAVLLAFAIAIFSMTSPAYAFSTPNLNLQPISDQVYVIVESASNLSQQSSAAISNLSQQSSAAISNFSQKSSEAIKRCFYRQPNDLVEEISCELITETMTAVMIVGTCYAANTAAASLFPPLLTLLPACQSLGIAKMGQKAAEIVLH